MTMVTFLVSFLEWTPGNEAKIIVPNKLAENAIYVLDKLLS